MYNLYFMYKFHLTPALAVTWLHFGSSTSLTTDQYEAPSAHLVSLVMMRCCPNCFALLFSLKKAFINQKVGTMTTCRCASLLGQEASPLGLHTHITDTVIYPSDKKYWPLQPFQSTQIHPHSTQQEAYQYIDVDAVWQSASNT